MAQQYNSEWEFHAEATDKILQNIQTNIHEIIKLCRDININKSSCVEHLSSEILRDAFFSISYILCDLYNLSFELSEVPDIWKIAKVTPLPKAGNHNDVSNLRPISLLPLPSKLIEKIVHDRIYIVMITIY